MTDEETETAMPSPKVVLKMRVDPEILDFFCQHRAVHAFANAMAIQRVILYKQLVYFFEDSI
jgi:hypothetical protein